jgi:ABC-type spermidine/putrescine transport system permease subunit II
MPTVFETQHVAGRLPPANQPAAKRQYAVYLAFAVGTVALLLAVGQWPTRRLGGEVALAAMVAGCGASLAGSLLGSVPIWLARGIGLPAVLPAVLGSLALRMAVVIGFGVALVVVAGFETTPLLLWLAISHGALLVGDVWLAIGAVRSNQVDRDNQVGVT